MNVAIHRQISAINDSCNQLNKLHANILYNKYKKYKSLFYKCYEKQKRASRVINCKCNQNEKIRTLTEENERLHKENISLHEQLQDLKVHKPLSPIPFVDEDDDDIIIHRRGQPPRFIDSQVNEDTQTETEFVTPPCKKSRRDNTQGSIVL